MDSAGRTKAIAIIDEALKRPDPEREAFVRAECPDAELCLKIIDLLRGYDGATLGNAVPWIDEVEDFDDLQPGTRVGPYVIVARLGRGGMGQVFLGNDPELDRRVALKCLTGARAGAGGDRARILHEARAAAGISHPHVATVHHVIEHRSRAFIVMEYVEGESLAARLKRERLPIERVVAIGRQLAAALGAAHAKGVVHGDLKPANVQLTPDGSLKVLDFGVARIPRAIPAGSTRARTSFDGETVQTVRGGTPPYMSPEQLMNRAVDERSDIYSLGVVLFEMAAGRRPFAGDAASELILAHALDAPRANEVDPRVPEALADIIAQALDPHLDGRFQSAAEVAAALEALADALDPKPPRRRERLVRAAARISVGIVATAVGLTALGLVSSGYFNYVLGRRGFDSEPLSTALLWGWRSLVGPALLVVLTSASVWAATAALRLVSVWRPMARAIADVRRWPVCAALESIVNDPVGLAQIAAAGGALSIVGLGWRYRHVVEAWGSFPDRAPASILAVLYDKGRQNDFRFDMGLVIVLMGFCLVRIAALRTRTRVPRGRSSLYGCLTVFALAILINDGPYRLIQDRDGERVVLSGNRCYIIGDRGDRLLLFCPDLNPPRNRIVTPRDPELRRLGFREVIFTPASRQ